MKKILFILLSIALIYPALAQEKFSKIKFYPPNNVEKRNELLAFLEVDHFYSEGEGLISEVDARLLQTLKKNGIRFEVLVDDVAEEFVRTSSKEDFYKGESLGIDQNRVIFEQPCSTISSIIKTPAAFTAGSMGGYYTYAEMEAKMDAVVAALPGFATKFSIGNSFQGRPIWCIKISDNVNLDEANEAEVLYSGLQHAREAIGGTSLIFFMQYLAENYASDSRVADLVNNREIYIIPCLNPDGYEYNRTTNPSGGGLWRKNRRLNSGGSFGVDLNRNWGIDWANCAGATTSCGSGTQTNDTYWGTAPFSEPETNALRNFILSHNVSLAIDQHCYGPYYSLPFGRPTLHTMSAIDQKFYSYTAALMGKYNCHRAGNSPQTVGYEVAGGMKDWMLLGDIGVGNKSKIYGLTGEAGGGTFWAPSASIIPLSKGLCWQNLQAAYVAGSYYEVQDMNDVAVTTTSGAFSARVRRLGVSGEDLNLSLVPIENIASVGGPVTINTFANFDDSYVSAFSYTLNPSITNGQRIRFAWKLQTGGYTWYDTVTKIYNPITLLFDNMEGSFATNWTATISPNATNGWNFTTNGGPYEGIRSMAESPTGNYTYGTTRRATYRNAINLADARAAYLSFWVKHKAENCFDKLRMQVSTNGGSTYTSVCGLNTIRESDGTLAGLPALTGIKENWTRELIDLTPYRGFSNVRFRFEFTSNANVTSDSYYAKVDDGFYIDNLRIIKTTAVLPSQANNLITLNGELINNAEGQLSWEAAADLESDYFVVERSVGGAPYKAIGTVKGFPPYSLTDNELQDGTNTYRVKQVRKSGEVLYSRAVRLVKSSDRFSLVLSPNPVKDQLILKVNSKTAEPVIIEVVDVLGRKLYNRSINILEGANTLFIDASKWKQQVYVLRVMNAKREVLSLEKVIK